MKLDCYGVLGLSPTAEDAVVRAAYLALMRSYHPDRNPTPEAAARVRRINEAYKTIGDPVRRAEYDAARTEHIYEILRYDQAIEPQPRKWPKLPAIHLPKVPAIQWPTAPAIPWPKARAAGMAGASAAVVLLAVLVLPQAQGDGPDASPSLISAGAAAPSPSPAAKEPSPEASTPAPAAEIGPPVPIDVEAPDEAAARPPEPARATATAVPAKADVSPPRATAETSAQRPAAVGPAPVDEKARIATLEWQSTSFYNQSVNHADDARRSELQQARNLLVAARGACGSDKCVGDAYVSHMRDISRIMQKRAQANP